MDEEFDFLVTTYNIMKDYVPANQMQGAADHLMGVIVDTMDELDLKEFVAATGCTYLKKSHSEYDVEDDYDDDADEFGSDYENYDN
jgi:hypothetical protein